MPVNEHIRDIFDHTDTSCARRYPHPQSERRGGIYFDREALERIAVRLLNSLSHFVVAAQLPTVEELVDDYLNSNGYMIWGE